MKVWSIVLALLILSAGIGVQASGNDLWIAQYYNNPDLSGQPVLIQTEADPSRNWGSGSPAAGIGANDFSVRWVSTQTLAAGRYRVAVRADDGVRVYINNQLIIDEWHGATGQTYVRSLDLAAGQHVFIIEYYERSGDAFISYNFSNITGTGEDQPVAAGQWVAQYYNNIDLSGLPAAIQTEASPNHNWGTAAPLPNIGADGFSVRWTSQQTLSGGTYRIIVRADDGVRVYVDNRRVIDQWQNATGQTYTADITLSAGLHIFTIEYYENHGDAFLNYDLRQLGSSIQQTAVPSGQWIAEYYNNPNLSGTPVTVQAETSPNHNWGTGAPLFGVGADNFSVRWRSRQQLTGGTYRISLRADDGVRLYIDNILLINEWHGATGQTYTVNVSLSAGAHDFVIEYYEATGAALLNYEIASTGGVNLPTPTPFATDQWLAEYFNNPNLSGTPVVIQSEPDPTHNWGTGSPAAGVNRDGFSARWTRTRFLNAGTYRITVQADDGVRIYVNGRLVLNQWQNATGQTYIADFTVTSGDQTIVVEYYENNDEAFLSYNLQPVVSPPIQPTITPPSSTWLAFYYNNRDLSGSPAAIITEDSPNHRWGQSAPLAGISADNFSVRWTRVEQLNGGTYRITVRADDGVRVYVDGSLVINEWHNATGQTYTADITLQSGQHTFTIEYYENSGAAFLEYELGNAADEPRYTGATGTVGLYRLNVREIPTTENSGVVTKINPGETYQIVGRNPDSTWWQIDVNGTFGWAFGRYIDVANTGSVPVTVSANIGLPPSAGVRGAALTDVNIRRGPNVRDDLLGTLPGGASAVVVGRNSNASWLQINYNGVVGWVINGALRVDSGAALNNLPIAG